MASTASTPKTIAPEISRSSLEILRDECKREAKNCVQDKKRQNGDFVFKHLLSVATQTGELFEGDLKFLAEAFGYVHDLKEDYPAIWKKFVIALKKIDSIDSDHRKALIYMVDRISYNEKDISCTYKSYCEELLNISPPGEKNYTGDIAAPCG